LTDDSAPQQLSYNLRPVYLPVACKTHSEKVEIRKGGGGLGLVINIARKTERRQENKIEGITHLST